MAVDRPNYYSTNLSFGAATSVESVSFGFSAATLRMANYTAQDIYARLAGDGVAATTADVCLKACSGPEQFWPALTGFQTISLCTTSTVLAAAKLNITAFA